MLFALPVETLLDIIQYLPIATVTSLSTLCKSWATFMDTNESSIYHNVSKQYGYALEGDPEDIAPSEGWKARFIHKFQTELRWIGRLPGKAYRVRVPGTASNFHRIKVDEEAGYVINTFVNGGLVVSDIRDHRILWSLDEESCGSFAHCEYDDGYLVFNRVGNRKEIWRRRIDVLDVPQEEWPSVSHNRPDKAMIAGNRVAEGRYLDASRSRDSDHLRGQFVPWGLVLIPENGRALKLTKGTLLVSGVHKLFIYDVETAELQQTIDMGGIIEGLKYVDVSERHALIVSDIQVKVYDRETGSLVLSIPGGRQPRDFYATPENQWQRTEETFYHAELGFRQAMRPNGPEKEDYFLAAHISSCGKNLAILTMSSRVILIQDFWKLFLTFSQSSPPTLIPSPIALKDITKQVDLSINRPMLIRDGYLAYGRGKVAILGYLGVYVLVLESILDQLGEIKLLPKDPSLHATQQASLEHKPSWPKLRLRQVKFDDLKINTGLMISCLQLTETKLYLSMIPSVFDNANVIPNDRGENMWCYDFASPPAPVADFPTEGHLDREGDWDEEGYFDADQDWDEEDDWDEIEARLAGDRRRTGRR